jgi:hypothetical protein
MIIKNALNIFKLPITRIEKKLSIIEPVYVSEKYLDSIYVLENSHRKLMSLSLVAKDILIDYFPKYIYVNRSYTDSLQSMFTLFIYSGFQIVFSKCKHDENYELVIANKWTDVV